jgi:Arc/MetJ-type ribon-helix-helix transcriptional regulator
MPDGNFRVLSINGTLVQEIEDYTKTTGRYKSVAEFVNEAARLRLEQLKNKNIQPEVP